MAAYFLATVGDLTDPTLGYFDLVEFPPEGFGEIVGESTVIAEGRPVATVGMLVTPHGNFELPKKPGYNPECGKAILTGAITSKTVLINGRPAAVVGAKGGTLCSCTHFIVGPGAPTILIGGVE